MAKAGVRHWTGAGDGANYNDPANWDVGVVPINRGMETYMVVIPASTDVTFDVPGSGLQVHELQLGGAGELFLDSNTHGLELLGIASIDGDIVATTSEFSAAGSGTAFTGPTRLFANAGGNFAVAATTYQGSFHDDQDIFSATEVDGIGAGSRLDLSSLTVLEVTDTRNYNPSDLTVLASNGGVVDPSCPVCSGWRRPLRQP